MNYTEIPSSKLTVSPFNIRHLTKFQLDTQLEEIKNSIKSNGIIQPLIVRKIKNKYEIATGQIRFVAGKKILKKFPCIVKNLSNQEVIEYSLIENLQRKDIDPLDVAKGLKQLKGMLTGLTFEQIAKKIGMTREMVWRYLSLLGLVPEVQKMVSENKISAKLGSKISTIEEKKQKEVAELLSKTPTDNESEEFIRKVKKEPEKSPKELLNEIVPSQLRITFLAGDEKESVNLPMSYWNLITGLARFKKTTISDIFKTALNNYAKEIGYENSKG